MQKFKISLLLLITLAVSLEAEAATFTIPLKGGWNFISLPLVPDNKEPGAVLSGIINSFEALYAYDKKSENYRTFVKDSAVNDLTEMDIGRGYWIYVNGDRNLSINGTESSAAVELDTGWNMVGFNRTTAMPVKDALRAIDNVVLYTFSNSSNSYEGGESPSFGGLALLEPGRGYWLFTDSRVTWRISESNQPVPAPARETRKITVALIGQSILHHPGGPGNKVLGKNLFHWLVEWGNGQVEQYHWTQSGVGLGSHVRFSETDALIKKGYDYFLMCEGTKFPFQSPTFAKFEEVAGNLGNRARAAGSIPVVYIAYAHNGNSKEKFFSTEEVMKNYMTSAANMKMPFIPVAHAIGEAVKKFGANNIYDDEKHIKADGQFIAGCVSWATLTLTPPSEIIFRGNPAGLRQSQAALTQVCRDTIEKYPPNRDLLKLKR